MTTHLTLALFVATGAMAAAPDPTSTQTEVVARLYPSMNHGGPPLELHMNDALNDIDVAGLNKTVDIVQPCGVYLYTEPDFGGTFIFITSSLSEIAKPYTPLNGACIPGTTRPNNQYDHVRSLRVVPASEVPQPTRWVPVDGRDIPTERTTGACDTPPMLYAHTSSQVILTVRQVFIWESTDCWDCSHGPWEELSVRTMAPEGALNHKLAGPTPYAHDKPFCGCWPSDEWGDDRQGMIFSNYGILNWATTSASSVSVVIQGGDDFHLIEASVSRDSTAPVFAMSNYGYVILQNVQGLEPKVCGGDRYVTDFPVSDGYWDGPNGPFHNYPLKGTRHFPYESLNYALAQTPQGGTLVLAAGRYTRPAGNTINQPITLRSCGGNASIGDRLFNIPEESVSASPNCSCGPF